MEGRIAHIFSILENAEIVEDTTSGDTVREGSIVSIQYVGDDDVERYLVGSIEERIDDAEVASPTSPLGEALLGSKIGEIVKYSAPGGLLEVEIIGID
jgi:transcription elongation factor GreA